MRFYTDPAKRLTDIVLSGFLLLTSWPLQAAIAVAVRLDSPGHPIHRATRLGRGGRYFTMYKFRTMADGADAGSALTHMDDSRVTCLGKWLRRTKLDELPQLWNVLVGDMSLVGPRPEDPRLVVFYSDKWRLVHSVRPGITGPCQLTFRDEELLLSAHEPEALYRREILPRKLELDINYVQHRSLGRDLIILLQTLILVTRQSHPLLVHPPEHAPGQPHADERRGRTIRE